MEEENKTPPGYRKLSGDYWDCCFNCRYSEDDQSGYCLKHDRYIYFNHICDDWE